MILRLVRSIASARFLYVRIRPDLLSVRDISSRKTLEDSPMVAITRDNKRSIVAVGANAEAQASGKAMEYDLVNAFDHPRSIISDFVVAEKTFQYFFRTLIPSRIVKPAPIIVIQVLENMEGGLTGVEVRALQELAIGAGALEAHIWTGREIMDYEFVNKRFPGSHWLPEQPKWAKT